jgi:hypothetical protein
VGVPPHQARSELFRSLGHPVLRIRVLELLDDAARRDGNTVEYSLSATEVTELRLEHAS